MSKIPARWNEQAQMLANRLRKNQKRLRKWAKRENITCYRLYDRDIPELPFVIDWYEGHLHIADFTKEEKNQREYEAWLALMIEEASTLLDVPEEKVFLKRRQRQKGKGQYQRFAQKRERFVVHEGGHKFWINLSDYLDTGLFLDHRPTRKATQEVAEGKNFLNLFSYTGAFTVYAAAGGATKTTTVDMSKTYIKWARDNIELNGHSLQDHRFVQADVFAFLKEPARFHQAYDLIVIDPPTFSNSKRMSGILDIQRDHVELLNRLIELATPNATIFFSNNFRKFRLEEDKINCQHIKDISYKSVPNDFHDKKIHQCWRLDLNP